MADPTTDPALSYLPPGWTEQRFNTSRGRDWKVLSLEELGKCIERRAAEAKLLPIPLHPKRKDKFSKKQVHIENALKRPNETADVESSEHPLVKLVEDAGLDYFGFFAFFISRLYEPSKTQFAEVWEQHLHQRVTHPNNLQGFSRIKDKFIIKYDQSYLRAPKPEYAPRYVADIYGFAIGDGEDGLKGLWLKMCLLIDAECIDSVLKLDPSDMEKPAFVKAVVRGYDDTVSNWSKKHGWPGYFKVAVSSLLLDFYPALYNCEDARELYQPGVEIWVQHRKGTASM